MKKYVLLILLICILGMTTLSAHPASLVNATFDKNENYLIVTFSHQVSTPASHFINQIKVQLNKKDIITQTNFSQENTDGGTFYYKIVDAKAGDKITVTTACNKAGKKATTIVVK